MLYYELRVDYRVLYCRTVVVVEIQQIENRIFWCGFGFHEDFCIGTVLNYPESFHFSEGGQAIRGWPGSAVGPEQMRRCFVSKKNSLPSRSTISFLLLGSRFFPLLV